VRINQHVGVNDTPDEPLEGLSGFASTYFPSFHALALAALAAKFCLKPGALHILLKRVAKRRPQAPPGNDTECWTLGSLGDRNKVEWHTRENWGWGHNYS